MASRSLRFTDLNEKLTIINRFAIAVLDAKTTDALLWMIAKNAVAELGFEDCVVYLKEKDRLIQRAAHGPKNPIDLSIYNPIEIDVGQGIVGSVAATGTAEIINNTSSDPRYILDDQMRLSEITVPIILNGEVLGVIDSEHPQADFYTREDLEILTTIASMSASKLAQLEFERQLTTANAELKSMNSELEKINLELDQFVYSVSHDLRAPLLSIKGVIDYVLQESEMEVPVKEVLKLANESATRLDSTIRDILEYSRNSRLETQVEEIDIVELTVTTMDELRFSIKEDIAFSIEAEGDRQVLSDRLRLNILLKNILGNSIKYRSKGKQLSVTVHIENRGESLKVSISDNGQGIEAKYLPRVFDMFFRATNTAYGSGLGLYICKEVVKKLNGTIELVSAPGAGTTVSFRLPLAQ